MKNLIIELNDEQRIQRLIDHWAAAIRDGRKDDVLKDFVSSALIYDVLPPLKYKGANAYRKSFDKWWPETEGPGIFELQNLHISAGETNAFAHMLVRCGEGAENTVRMTLCLSKHEGKWQIAHQHASMPIKI